MKSWIKFTLGCLLGGVTAMTAFGQQLPVVAVDVRSIGVFSGSASPTSNGSVVYYQVTAGGAGYINGATVNVVPVGLDPGAGATATAIVAGGVVTAVLVNNPGSGYVLAPTVTITAVSGGAGATAVASLGDYFGPPFSSVNESFGPAGTQIGISALAVGTNPVAGFIYTFYVNGQTIGTLTPNPPNGTPGTLAWTPPQPGSYFITVKAEDGISPPVTSLAVRYFATGTMIVSPVNNTLVPVGSSVVIQSVGMPEPVGLDPDNAFVQRMEFYADGTLIGTDLTYPYSIIYTPTAAPGTHVIEARAFDNNGNQVSLNGTATKNLTMVAPTGTPPTCSINSPLDGAAIAIPDYVVEPTASVTVAIDAFSSGGTIGKVELYIDGVLFGTKTSYPYTFAWKPQVVGEYRFVALAYDDKNNVVASTTSLAPTSTPAPTTVTVAAAPTVVITSPSDGASVAGGATLAVTAVASNSNGNDIVSVQFFDSGTFVGEATVPTAGTTSSYSIGFTPTQKKDTDGNIIPSELTALAIDEIGLSKLSAGVTLNVTSGGVPPPPPVIGDPPTVSLTAPIASSQLAVGSTATLTAIASDTDGNIASVQFFVNGQSVGTDSTYPYAATWTPTSLGAYTISVKVTDNDANLVTGTPVSVTVIDPGPNPPVVNIVSPVAGAGLTSGNPITIQATATDEVAVASVQFYVNGQPLGTLDTSFPYDAAWTPSSPGSYTLAARATDNIGNQTTSAPIVVTVTAGAAPSVSLTNMDAYSVVAAGSIVNLTATAGDADGTVASVRFLANGIVIATATALPYVGSWKPTSAGTYTMIAQATDNAGNITNSDSRIVVVLDNDIPQPTLTSPANGATVRVGIGLTLTATAVDFDGTIGSVEFFANGVSLGTSTTPPYKKQWTPSAEGVYRLTVSAVDNAGAVGVSSPVLVVASTTAADTIVTGTYQGVGEAGYFALVAATGNTAAFIAYSATPAVKTSYYHANIPLDVSGGYSLDDVSGRSLISGMMSDTGSTGTFDGGRLTFIGLDTGFFPIGHAVASGYYEGKLTGRAASSLAAIVGEDGSITFRVADGAFDDAGGGATGGKLDSTGAFSVTTMRGNRFSGRVDPVTGVLAATLSGANGGPATASSTALGASSVHKVLGAASEVLSNVYLPAKGNTYDQVLLEGSSASVTADTGQITRISYVDLSNDIVQVEFSGAGRLTLSLDNASGPVAAVNYNQPEVRYMKGHARIVITGSDETTNLSVFSVGRITAANQALFKSNVNYDGVADIGYVAIMSSDGKFGGLRTANASYLASTGMTGLCAPGVEFTGPVYVGDITAANTASPLLVLGSSTEVQINGGDLWQANSRPVQVSGIERLRFVNGTTSHGVLLYAQPQRSRLEQDGIDVTAQVAARSSP